jgi:hypothetical protein
MENISFFIVFVYDDANLYLANPIVPLILKKPHFAH